MLKIIWVTPKKTSILDGLLKLFTPYVSKMKARIILIKLIYIFILIPNSSNYNYLNREIKVVTLNLT